MAAARSSSSGTTLPVGRSGRLLALGLTVLVLVLVWIVVVNPLLGWYGDRADALAARQAVSTRMATLAAQLPALRREAAVVRQGAPVALISGASDAVAGAALQDKVQQMASSLGATLSSTESLPASQRGAYRRIGVRISVTAPFEVMVRLIAAIEQASPSMLIDDLQLHGSRILLQSAQPLEGAMTILAFRQADAGSVSKATPDAPSEGSEP